MRPRSGQWWTVTTASPASNAPSSKGSASACASTAGAFQRVDDYQPPQWPGQGPPQQSHLDFEVDDLDVAEAELLRLGASGASDQPHASYARVFLDPAGHPFCVTTSKTARR
jgi:hypothetical protein